MNLHGFAGVRLTTYLNFITTILELELLSGDCKIRQRLDPALLVVSVLANTVCNAKAFVYYLAMGGS